MRVCSGYIEETDSKGKRHKINFEIPGSKTRVCRLLKLEHPGAKVHVVVKYRKGKGK